jgi:uncharacterized iron-regulated membrane protein
MKIPFKHWKTIHSYIGLFLAGLLFLVGFTGFIMLKRDRFGLKDRPVSFSPLLAWYASLRDEEVDFKQRTVITLYTENGMPVEIASDHGALLVSNGNGRWEKAEDSALNPAVVKKSFAKTESLRQRPLHWGNVIDDLHTGRFFGGWLNLLYYGTAFCLVGLTATGVYLWYKPWAQKRKRHSFQQTQKPSNNTIDSAMNVE